MIGIHHQGYKIIAAAPLNGGEPGEMVVVGESLPARHGRHSATFVTWFTDSKGAFTRPQYHIDHALPVDILRNQAVGAMIRRAGHIMTPFNF